MNLLIIADVTEQEGKTLHQLVTVHKPCSITRVVILPLVDASAEKALSIGFPYVLTMGLQATKLFGYKGTSMKSVLSSPFKYEGLTVYPTNSYKELMSYSGGYKGINTIKENLTRISELPNQTGVATNNIVHIDSVELGRKAIKALEHSAILALDIETAGYDVPREAQLDYDVEGAEIVVIAIGNNEVTYVFNTHVFPNLVPHICKLLEMPKTLYTWNGTFDLAFIKALWGTVPHSDSTLIDGHLCFYLYDSNTFSLGSSLKLASKKLLPNGASYADYQMEGGIDVAIKNGDGHYIAEHIKEYMQYCGMDVALTYKLCEFFWENLTPDLQTKVTGFYVDLMNLLHKLGRQGIRVDVDKMESQIDSLRAFLSEIEEDFDKQYPNINIRSTKDCAYVIYDIRGVPNTNPEGKQSTAVEVLEANADDFFCKQLLDYRSFDKQLTMLVSIQESLTVDGRCCPKYNCMRTATGRLASHSPSIHTIPKVNHIVTPTNIPASSPAPDPTTVLKRAIWKNHKVVKSVGSNPIWQLIETSPFVKDIFVPDEGHSLIYSDYSQLEVVILANLIDVCSPDKSLQNAIREGKDIHSYTTSLVYSILKGQTFTADFIQAHKGEEPFSGWRQTCKSILFKLIYGGTSESLAKDMGMTSEEAATIWSTFLKVIPGLVDYTTLQVDAGIEAHQIVSSSGHKRGLEIYSIFRNSTKAKNISLNHPIQSFASYLVLEALVELDKRLPSISSSSRILLTVHDSIAIQVPAGKEAEGKALLQSCMIDYIHKKFPFLTVPLSAKAEVGSSWYNLS